MTDNFFFCEIHLIFCHPHKNSKYFFSKRLIAVKRRRIVHILPCRDVIKSDPKNKLDWVGPVDNRPSKD